ncbi:MAG: peptidoglycan DD-metalloendopeptidase family protein [Chitinophagales bacterium]
MLKLKIFITFFTLVLLASSFDEKEQVFSRQGNSKAFYNTSYGRLAFNEILIKRKVKNDEFLSNIFERNRLGYDNLQKLIEQPDSLFNERRIRVGNNYGVTYKFINNKITPEKFIYEKNKVDFIVATLSENFDLELKQKDIEIKSFSTSGEINSSLYLTMQENNINPLLAIDLSEIYAWTIDFYKIQKGDKFKIIYTEEFVEGKSLNQFKINASTFTHRGVEKEAYFYKGKDEIIGHFYDENGDNMKQAFLKAPVKYSRISSVFSPKRFHPVQKRWKAHLGTDYAAPRGTPIYATADGVVIASQFKKYNGHYVKVKHNGMYSTQYLHMTKRAVKKGDYVAQGQVIGYVGSTGLATGPHVCYRFWKNGKQVDPNKQDLPKAKPIEAKYLEDFLEKIKPLKQKIQKINNNNKDEV